MFKKLFFSIVVLLCGFTSVSSDALAYTVVSSKSINYYYTTKSESVNTTALNIPAGNYLGIYVKVNGVKNPLPNPPYIYSDTYLHWEVYASDLAAPNNVVASGVNYFNDVIPVPVGNYKIRLTCMRELRDKNGQGGYYTAPGNCDAVGTISSQKK